MSETESSEQIYEINGLQYKIGVHGLVFFWNGEEWVNSELELHDIRRRFSETLPPHIFSKWQ